MRRVTRRATGLALTGLLVAAVPLACTALGSPGGQHVLAGHGRSDQPALAAPSTSNHQFHIAGGLGGLFPGTASPLVLSVYNPNKVAITVTSITTTVGDASTGCPATYLSVASFGGSLAVGPKQTATVAVPAQLSHSAPDACQGAVFPLRYSGVGYGS